MKNQQNLPPQALLMHLINGKHISRAISIVADLGISDLLSEGEKSAKYLAEQSKTHEDSLHRVIRLLTRVGIFTEVDDGVYANNSLSELLGDSHANSVRKYAQWMGTSYHWDLIRDLDYAVKTGNSVVLKDSDKTDPFAVLEEYPSAFKVFQEAMTGMSLADGHAIAEAYDWADYNRIMDVGGGYGTLAGIVARKVPNAQVTVFDRPAVIQVAQTIIEQSGLANLDAKAGDFFEAIPGKADLILMKYIIHDWNDEKSTEILNNCKQALSENGKIILCEMLITKGPESVPAQVFDLEMMIGPQGKERTTKQFKALFEKAGFKLNKIIPTKSLLKLFELEPK